MYIIYIFIHLLYIYTLYTFIIYKYIPNHSVTMLTELSSGKLLHIQGVPGGKDLTLGECSLGQTVPI
jgi:hypothetical protein